MYIRYHTYSNLNFYQKKKVHQQTDCNSTQKNIFVLLNDKLEMKY